MIAQSRNAATIISPVRAGVRCRSDKRIIAAPMRIATSPVQQASLSRQAIWWRGDGHTAFNWNGSAARIWERRAQTIAQRPMVLEEAGVKSLPVIASEAKQSMHQRARWAWIASSAALLAMTVAGITTPLP
jgi:hypothetical protein